MYQFVGPFEENLYFVAKVLSFTREKCCGLIHQYELVCEVLQVSTTEFVVVAFDVFSYRVKSAENTFNQNLTVCSLVIFKVYIALPSKPLLLL